MDQTIIDGFKLMGIGMGMVCVFLTVMVLVITFMAKVLAPYAHLLEDKSVATASNRKDSTQSKSDDVISAIVAAVHKYRSEH